MTELEKRVEEYLGNNYCKNVCTSQENEECVNGIRIRCMSFNDKKKHLVDFAKQETEYLSKHILDLQKDKGELTDKCRELEDKLANADYQLEGRDLEIKELKAQLEQAKEIIRELLSLPYANDWEVYAPVSEYLSRAEAFLNSEVEK